MPEWLPPASLQERGRQAEDSVPRRQRTPFDADPNSETVGVCQSLTAWTAGLWTVWSPASPRFLPCVTQQRAAPLQDVQPEKGPVDLRLGCGSESRLSTRPCRFAGLLRLPHRFTGALGRWLAGSVTTAILLWAFTHHQAIAHPAPTTKSAPRLARHPPGPPGPPP